MAKTKGKNTSQSIRDYLTAKPDSKAKEVVEALARAGCVLLEVPCSVLIVIANRLLIGYFS